MKLISSIVVGLAVLARATPCSDDIEAAGSELAKATEDVLAAVADCASGGNSTQCAEDVSKVVGAVSTAAEFVNKAVTDCGGQGSQCAADLTELVADLSAASGDIAKAVDDCPGKLLACVADVSSTAKALYAGGKSIAAAVSDCSNSTRLTSRRPAVKSIFGDDYSCPGSDAMVHAWCEQTATFGASCDVVSSEITARVKGQHSVWHDPHNNGTYSILSADSKTIQLKRTTANLKYTDKITLTLAASGSGCKLMGCSESQVTSIADYSTNYCNVRVLYCGANDGCKHAGTDLVSSVTDVSKSFGASKTWSDCLKV